MMRLPRLASRWLEFCGAGSIVGRTTLVPPMAYLLRLGLGDNVPLRWPVFHLSPIPFLVGRLPSAGRLKGEEEPKEQCKMMTSL